MAPEVATMSTSEPGLEGLDSESDQGGIDRKRLAGLLLELARSDQSGLRRQVPEPVARGSAPCRVADDSDGP